MWPIAERPVGRTNETEWRNEMKMLRTLTTVVCLVVFIALMVGCVMQDYLSPMYIDKRIGECTGAKMTSLLPFTTIADGKRLGRELNFISVEKREAWLQAIEKDGRLQAFLSDSIAVNLISAQELQKTLFSPTGVFGAMTGLMGLGAGAMFIRRPGDLRPEDVEEA